MVFIKFEKSFRKFLERFETLQQTFIIFQKNYRFPKFLGLWDASENIQSCSENFLYFGLVNVNPYNGYDVHTFARTTQLFLLITSKNTTGRYLIYHQIFNDNYNSAMHYFVQDISIIFFRHTNSTEMKIFRNF
jgi:hypothetical protein